MGENQGAARRGRQDRTGRQAGRLQARHALHRPRDLQPDLHQERQQGQHRARTRQVGALQPDAHHVLQHGHARRQEGHHHQCDQRHGAVHGEEGGLAVHARVREASNGRRRLRRGHHRIPYGHYHGAEDPLHQAPPEALQDAHRRRHSAETPRRGQSRPSEDLHGARRPAPTTEDSSAASGRLAVRAPPDPHRLRQESPSQPRAEQALHGGGQGGLRERAHEHGHDD